MELGLFPGARIRVLQNAPEDSMLAVQAGASRLVLSREIAAGVSVSMDLGRAMGSDDPMAMGSHGLLREIRRYLGRHGEADTTAIALHLETDETAVTAMLAFLEARGQIIRKAVACGAGGCGGCRGCGAATSGVTHYWSLAPQELGQPQR